MTIFDGPDDLLDDDLGIGFSHPLTFGNLVEQLASIAELGHEVQVLFGLVDLEES